MKKGLIFLGLIGISAAIMVASVLLVGVESARDHHFVIAAFAGSPLIYFVLTDIVEGEDER